MFVFVFIFVYDIFALNHLDRMKPWCLDLCLYLFCCYCICICICICIWHICFESPGQHKTLMFGFMFVFFLLLHLYLYLYLYMTYLLGITWIVSNCRCSNFQIRGIFTPWHCTVLPSGKYADFCKAFKMCWFWKSF